MAQDVSTYLKLPDSSTIVKPIIDVYIETVHTRIPDYRFVVSRITRFA